MRKDKEQKPQPQQTMTPPPSVGSQIAGDVKPQPVAIDSAQENKQSEEANTSTPQPEEQNQSVIAGIGDMVKSQEDKLSQLASEREAARAKVRDAIANKRSALNALFEKEKPVREVDKEKQLRRYVLAQGLANIVSSVFQGVYSQGKNGAGVVYQPDTTSPAQAIARLNQMDKEYTTRGEKWRALMLQRRAAEMDDNINDLNAEYAATDKLMADGQKSLDKLKELYMKGLISKEELIQKQDDKMKQIAVAHQARLREISAKGNQDIRVASIKKDIDRSNDEGDALLYQFGTTNGIIPKDAIGVRKEDISGSTSDAHTRTITEEGAFNWKGLSAEQQRAYRLSARQRIGGLIDECKRYGYSSAQVMNDIRANKPINDIIESAKEKMLIDKGISPEKINKRKQDLLYDGQHTKHDYITKR